MQIFYLGRYIQRELNERRKMLKIIESKQRFLLPGKYSLALSGKRVAFIKNKKSISFLSNNLNQMVRDKSQKSSLVKNLIKYFLGSINTIRIGKLENSEFQGTLLMSTFKGEAKIFNFDKEVVIHFFNSKNDYLKLKENYYEFKDYFFIPILSFWPKEIASIETYLNFTPSKFWHDNEKNTAIQVYLNNYTQYVMDKEEQGFRKNYLKETLNSIDRINHPIINKLNSHLSELNLNENWPVARVHGDLNFNNILLVNDKYYFIDWEYSSNLIFFYDFFNLIFTEAIDHEDYNFIENYLNGDYDKAISRLFNEFNFEYINKLKFNYLVIFIIIKIAKFEMIERESNLNEVLDRYEYVLENIITKSNFYKKRL